MTRLTADQKKERAELLKSITLKRVVMGRGHDCGGLIADVYFKRKLVATYHDDGWGGEPEVRFMSNELEKDVFDYLAKNEFAKHMFETDWGFMKELKKITPQTAFECAVDFIASEMEELKQIKKLQTAKFVIEKDGNMYTVKTPKSFAQMKKARNYKEWLDRQLKRFEKDGYTVLNTNL